MSKFITLFLLVFIFSVNATSQCANAQALNNNDAPIEISADNSLEWLQNKKQYVAIGNVEVTQGTSKILCDRLVADYRENKTSGKTEIWQLNAYNNVRLINDDNQAQGDQATHNIDTGLSTLIGSNLKLTMPEQTLTASQRIEYNMMQGIAKAVGDAKIVRGTDSLSANNIDATFGKDTTGKQILHSAIATGGVVIITPDEKLTGRKAVYDALKNTAEVTGNVIVKRGPNKLQGARAQVNLTTNISKMYGAPKSGGRVKGIFYPSSKKDK
jgi:lipopolysaccharide export system protein LptA